jgi:hypothetical protein
MVKYLVMKAKFSFALEEHSTLLEELRVLRAEECALRQGKDEALDSVMRMEFGPAVDQLLSKAGDPSPQAGSYTPEGHAPPESLL